MTILRDQRGCTLVITYFLDLGSNHYIIVLIVTTFAVVSIKYHIRRCKGNVVL